MADVPQLLDQALELGEEGRWSEMADLLRVALREHEDDPYVLSWLGVAERELGNDGVAYEYFKRCWAAEPLDPQVLAVCGAGLAAFDDPEAASVLRAAALTGPDVPIARLQYGAYLAREGLFAEAIEQLNAAVELDPEDPTIRGELGIAYALKGDMAGAAAAMETALEMAPDDSWTRVLLGLVYIETGSLEEAAETLIRAADERGDDAEAIVLAALTAAAAGWSDAAEDAIARAEYAGENVDAEVIEEARERIDDGAEAARQLLTETLAPSVLHDRLMQPL